MTLKVGSIVICHGWADIEGLKGFIEEIVSDPAIHNNMIWAGTYSIYGLQKANNSEFGRYYFGDFSGTDLDETGKDMTKEELEKFMRVDDEDKMLQKSVAVVIKNLGRQLGKNEGRVDIWKELANA